MSTVGDSVMDPAHHGEGDDDAALRGEGRLEHAGAGVPQQCIRRCAFSPLRPWRCHRAGGRSLKGLFWVRKKQGGHDPL
jgi:hypothetical protein